MIYALVVCSMFGCNDYALFANIADCETVKSDRIIELKNSSLYSTTYFCKPRDRHWWNEVVE